MKYPRKKQRLAIFLCLTALMLFAYGCAGQEQTGQEENTRLMVAAASDLRFAFEEMGQAFTAQTGIPVVFNYGATGQLAQQIANGAPVDVFAAADAKTIEGLADQGIMVKDSLCRYGEGRLVLLNSPALSEPLTSLEELLNPQVKKIAIANPQHAPYGLAAKEALINSGLWEKVQDKIVYGENIRDAMTLVESGNADVGLISHALVINSDLNYTLIDAKLHNPIIQTMGMVAAGKNQNEARAFIQFVQGPEGQKILQKYGFTIPSEAHD